jgi:hypothetical protein
MIKEKGETEFLKYMIDKNWVTIKTGIERKNNKNEEINNRHKTSSNQKFKNF